MGSNPRPNIEDVQRKTSPSPGPFAYDPLASLKSVHNKTSSVDYDRTVTENTFNSLIDRFVQKR